MDTAPDRGISFKPTIEFQISYYGVALLMMLFGVGSSVLLWNLRNTQGAGLAYVICFLSIVAGIWVAYWVSEHRLTLSPAGIEFQLPFFSISSGWENVAGFARETHAPVMLVLKEPGNRNVNGILGRVSAMAIPPDQIPIWRFMRSRFWNRWGGDTLTLAMMEYLSHVIKIEENVKK